MLKSQEETVRELARALLHGMTEGNKRDLGTMRLSQMEGEVYSLVDQVSHQMLQALLEQQARQVEHVEHCPQCHAELELREPQETPLQLLRGAVQWKQPVRRCLRCRRDFFPSGGGPGV